MRTNLRDSMRGATRRLAAFVGPSIARRLAMTTVLSYLIAWALVYAIAQWHTHAEVYGEFDVELESVAESIQRTLDAGHGPEALVGLAMRLEADRHLMTLPPGYARFEVRDRAGLLYAQSQEAGAGPALPGAIHEGLFNIDRDGVQLRVLRKWTHDGRLRIDVIQSVHARHAAFMRQAFNAESLVQLALALPVLLLPTWLAVRTGLRPLRRLSQKLAERSPGDLSPLGIRLPHSELAPVVRELDGTLLRLNELLQRERALLADSAHELRTPLALIAAQVDALLYEDDPDERDLAARRLAGGIGRCTRLVNQLLALARLEAYGAPADGCVDLADVARDGLALHAFEADERGVDIAYLGPDSLQITGTAAVIEDALGNLVANAIRHGRSPGRVELRLERTATEVVLSVADDGPGIPVDERGRVFDRFVRGRTAGGTGSGLGLAIVASAARKLDARIELGEGIDGRGLCVRLTWALR